MTVFVINNGEVNGDGEVVISNSDLGVGDSDDQIDATIEADPNLTDDIDEIVLPILGPGLDDIDQIEFDLTNFADDFTIVIGPYGSSPSTDIAECDEFTFPGATIISGSDLNWTLEYTGSDGNTYTITIEPQDDDAEGSLKIIVCFTRGTLIKTDAGEIPVEQLSIGDRVLTMDCGYQTIRWIGSNRVTADGLADNPNLLPIRIQAGALGAGNPERDLVVSRQHRVLVRSVIAQRMFDTAEVLVPANKLLTLDGVDVEEDAKRVEYWHFLFDDHQVVWSNGAATESLFTGPEALKAVSPEAKQEITALFPEIAQPGYVAKAARRIPEKGKQMKRLVMRHQKNQKPVFDDVARH